MKNILWFCKSNDSSSLSRITDSILPLLKNKYNITLLTPETSLSGIKHVKMGQNTTVINYEDFIKTMPDAIKDGKINDNIIRGINMKYVILQLVDLIYDNNYDYLVICNGIFEIDWIAKILSNSKYLTNKNNKLTKLVVWAPIDYIPSINVLKNALQADIFLTMTPIMIDEINKIAHVKKCLIDWVGHGSDIDTQQTQLQPNQIVNKLNLLRSQKLIICKKPFTQDDIIILNANNYGPINIDLNSVENTPGTRKRLDITLKAFIKVLNSYPNIMLWIHTNLKSFFDMLAIEGISLSTLSDNIILSNNTLSNQDLSLIYSHCKISIQTSYAEGWSLTNMEATLYRSLQIVPDFLATGWHFSNNRGLLIPVTKTIIKNEANIDVTIGVVSIEDTTLKLLEGIKLLGTEQLEKILDNAYNYAKTYTWQSITDKLDNILSSFNEVK